MILTAGTRWLDRLTLMSSDYKNSRDKCICPCCYNRTQSCETLTVKCLDQSQEKLAG